MTTPVGIAGWVLLAVANMVATEAMGQDQSGWEQRVLRSGSRVKTASYLQQAGQASSPAQSSSAGQAAPIINGGGAVMSTVEPAASMPVEGLPPTEPYVEGPDAEYGACGGCGGCDECGPCNEMPICGDCCWLRRFSFFAGVQGFKGDADQGRNGNFGFHEGFNFGAPLGGAFGWGYQIGFDAVHSNFQGSQVTGDDDFDPGSRNQFFITTGLFRRAREYGGLQGGIVFDYLHDKYLEKADVGQIRGELSIVLDELNELGYWGAQNIKEQEFTEGDLADHSFTSVNQHTFFYRRHFTGGGQGRIWGGFTDQGDGLLGADATVPLGTSWSLQNSFNYLLPRDGDEIGQAHETWAVALRLVWYPGRPANRVFRDPYQPVLDVGDNASFLGRFK
jgi:hypothetical protein